MDVQRMRGFGVGEELNFIMYNVRPRSGLDISD